MSTRPLPPPATIPDDPGPWSVVSSVFSRAGRPGRRRELPPVGLMLAPPPDLPLALAGTDDTATLAGAAPVRVLAAAREPAFTLQFDAGGATLRGVSPYVIRTWSLPELLRPTEERPGDDPAAALPPPVPPGELTGDLPGAVVAPGGDFAAVPTLEGRARVLALVRLSDRALVRWIRGARAGAWSADGSLFAIGGEWGVMLTGIRGPAEGRRD